jgi:hypothetical protein
MRHTCSGAHLCEDRICREPESPRLSKYRGDRTVEPWSFTQRAPPSDIVTSQSDGQDLLSIGQIAIRYCHDDIN